MVRPGDPASGSVREVVAHETNAPPPTLLRARGKKSTGPLKKEFAFSVRTFIVNLMKTTKKTIDAGTKTDTLWSLVEDLLATGATRGWPRADARTYEQEVAARDIAAETASVIADVVGDGFVSGNVIFLPLPDPEATKRATEEAPAPAATVFAAVVPGKSITVFGFHNGTAFQKRFEIGDHGTYGSYNLIYTGRITSITAKTVLIEKDEQSKVRKVLKLRRFAEKHYHFDLASIEAHNRDAYMHI